MLGPGPQTFLQARKVAKKSEQPWANKSHSCVLEFVYALVHAPGCFHVHTQALLSLMSTFIFLPTISYNNTPGLLFCPCSQTLYAHAIVLPMLTKIICPILFCPLTDSICSWYCFAHTIYVHAITLLMITHIKIMLMHASLKKVSSGYKNWGKALDINHFSTNNW